MVTGEEPTTPPGPQLPPPFPPLPPAAQLPPPFPPAAQLPPPFPPPPAGPPPFRPVRPPVPTSRRRLGWIVPVAIVGVLALVAAGVLVAGSTGDGPDHPDAWDPRIEELVAFVEQARARDFAHPIAVNFLADDAYEDQISGAGGDPTEDDRREADRQVASYRALGLVEGEIDLFETSDDIGAKGSAAYYDPATDQVFVRGTDLDVGARATVVHELTHALQNQIAGAAEQDDDEDIDDSSDASTAYRALLEGDASSVENAYVDQLDAEDFDSFMNENEVAVDESQAALDEEQVPGVFQAAFALPYALGPIWVDAVIGADGSEAIARALTDPPTSAVSMIDLQRDVDDPPVEVSAPEPADGADVLETDRVGADLWLVALAEYTDGATAFEAVRGWAGDEVVSSSGTDDRVCVDAAVRFVDAPAAARFATAATSWFGALPLAAGARVTSSGDQVDLHSCDPGPEADIALTGKAYDNLGHVVARNQVIGEFVVAAGGDIDDGACLADVVLARFGADRILTDPALAESAELAEVVQQSVRTCVPGG